MEHLSQKTPQDQHYIAYHNSNDFGAFKGDYIFTAKRVTDVTIGNRIWIIQGYGKPRRYTIVAAGTICRLAEAKRPAAYRRKGRDQGTNVHFTIDGGETDFEVTDESWFQALKKQQQNFSRGFVKLSASQTIQALERCWLSRSVVSDVQEIQSNDSLSATTKKALIDARLGQGKFRKSLLERWKRACGLTGISIEAVLRASHIKPWRSSSNQERLDRSNGLLLAAHVDALFDSGLISFGDGGQLLLAENPEYKEAAAEITGLQLPKRLRCELEQEEKKFLGWHRRHYGFPG